MWFILLQFAINMKFNNVYNIVIVVVAFSISFFAPLRWPFNPYFSRRVLLAKKCRIFGWKMRPQLESKFRFVWRRPFHLGASFGSCCSLKWTWCHKLKKFWLNAAYLKLAISWAKCIKRIINWAVNLLLNQWMWGRTSFQTVLRHTKTKFWIIFILHGIWMAPRFSWLFRKIWVQMKNQYLLYF